MAKKLYYFDLNGVAEFIRYILHYSGQEFEDIRYDVDTWPVQSVKESLPYGQFPVYEEDGKTLNQSLAIARYVGGKAHLVPTDPWEQALLDAKVFNIFDFRNNLIKLTLEPDATKKKAMKDEILHHTIDYYFSRFESELKEGNGYFGGKLSWADFVFVGIVEVTNMCLGTNVVEKYPLANSLTQKIQSLPGVMEYIAKRKPYTMNHDFTKLVK